jgi:hypothetical protein
MSTIGLYSSLPQPQFNALRGRLNALAADFGYTAQRGPTAGEGNLVGLLEAIDAGEVALVLLPPEHQVAAAAWLEGQARAVRAAAADFAALGLAEALEVVAAALREARGRGEE